MENALTLPTPQTIEGFDEDDVRRLLADLLRGRARDETYIAALGDKLSYAEYAATMLWDLVVHGKAMYSDGEAIEISDTEEWLKITRFLFSHLDGPARESNQFNGVNVFKIYAGFDPDRV